MDKYEQLRNDFNSLESLVAGFCGSGNEFRNFTQECAVRIWSKNLSCAEEYAKAFEIISGKYYSDEQLETVISSFRGNTKDPKAPAFFAKMAGHDREIGEFITGFNSLLVTLASINGDFNLEEANEVQRIMYVFYSQGRSGGYSGILSPVFGAIDEMLDFGSDLITPKRPSKPAAPGNTDDSLDQKLDDFQKELQNLTSVNRPGNRPDPAQKAGPDGPMQEKMAEAKEPEVPRSKEELDKLMAEMNELVGMENIKNDVRSLMNFIKITKLREERGLKNSKISYHLVFTGNPGTGKTTIARLIASLYYQIGVLPKGQLVEVDRGLLVAGYVGQTAIKTQKVIDEAMGGVLFIDEAYSLANNQDDGFGQEAIETILKNMEDHRDELVVIVAGYPELMHKFIDSNPGLSSRFNKYFEFKDYTGMEMLGIFKMFCKKNGYTVDGDTEEMLLDRFDKMYENRDENFGNGRTVRNIFEKAIGAQADRLAALEEVSKATDDQLSLITQEDLEIGFVTVEGVNLPKETEETAAEAAAPAAPAADEGVAEVSFDEVIGVDHPEDPHEGTDPSQN